MTEPQCGRWNEHGRPLDKASRRATSLAKFIAWTAGETRCLPVGEDLRYRSACQGIALSRLTRGACDRSVTRGLRVLGTMMLACWFLLPAAQAQQQPSVETEKPALVLGKPAPPFIVTTLNGKEVSLSDYKGKTLIVNFWATWCGNCKVEMPWLAQLREKYAGRGVEVLGILTDNASPTKIAAITQKYGVRYPILMCNHKTAQAYGGLPDLPDSVFIDRRGKIVAELEGADSKEQIEINIRKSLGLGAK